MSPDADQWNAEAGDGVWKCDKKGGAAEPRLAEGDLLHLASENPSNAPVYGYDNGW